MKMTILEFPVLPSTSRFLKTHYQDFPSGTIVRADFQTDGYGQRDHQWESEPNENLLVSVLIKPTKQVEIAKIKLAIINLIQGLLNDLGINAWFKEPNDFYVGTDKIAGILIETKTEAQMFLYIVIGIGLNVNQEKFPLFPATSIKKLQGKTNNINHLFVNLCQRFSDFLSQYD